MKDKCDDRIKADQKKLRRQDQGEIEMTESKGGRSMERFNIELEELKKKQKELESACEIVELIVLTLNDSFSDVFGDGRRIDRWFI